MISTNAQLIKHLTESSVLVSKNLIDAFESVDRVDFLPSAPNPYGDFPISIGYEQTNSQPTTVAITLEFLKPEKGEKILDVGAGSGWTTALLAHMVGDKGKVYGVERISELVDFGSKNLEKYDFDNVSINLSGKEIGLVKEASFDKILVSAAAKELPEELVEQLKIGGRMVIPVRNSVWVVDKINKNEFEVEKHYGFSFVPLV